MNKFKILIVLLMLSFLTGVSFSEDDIKINLYGKDIELNIKPYIDSNNRTMIPVRVVSEALGAEVTWKSKSEEVIIVSKDKTIVLKIDDKLMLINGEKVQMDTSPTIKDSSTFVPIRFISEALDLKIEWKEDTSTIVLNEKAEDTLDKGDLVESLEKLREDVRKLIDKLPPNTQTTENLYTLLSDSEEALAGTEINQEIYLRYANDKSIVDGYEYLKRIEKEKDYRKELDELSEQVDNWINENPIVEGTPKWEEYQKINGSIFEVNYYSIIVTDNDYNQIKDYFEKLKEM